jgi:hypothetical protein
MRKANKVTLLFLPGGPYDFEIRDDFIKIGIDDVILIIGFRQLCG